MTSQHITFNHTKDAHFDKI